MISVPTKTAERMRRLPRVGIVLSWILFAHVAASQEAAELSGLILEPMLLTKARAAPLDLGSAGDRDTRAFASEVDDRNAAIARLRRRDASSPELIEHLAYLAIALQGLERDEEALDVLEEAVAMTQRNGGRDNLEQIPLLEQMIVSYRARGDFKRIDETEDSIFALKQRGLLAASRDMYYATINLADSNTTAYFRENFGVGIQALRRQRMVIQRAPRAIADTTGETNEIFSGDIKDVFDQDINDVRLRRIDRLYKDYQEAVAERGNAQLDIMLDLMKRIARLAYHTKQEMDFERQNSSIDPNYEGSREQAARNSPRRMEESYESGRAALRYAIDLLRTVDGVRPEAVAAGLLDLADWHLAYGKAQAARDAYGEAYAALRAAGFTSANIDLALATELPPAIPMLAAGELRSPGRVEVRYYYAY